MEKYREELLSEMLDTVDVYICSKGNNGLIIHDWNTDLKQPLPNAEYFYTENRDRHICIDDSEVDFKYIVGSSVNGSFAKNGINNFQLEVEYNDSNKIDRTDYKTTFEDKKYDCFIELKDGKNERISYKIQDLEGDLLTVSIFNNNNTRYIYIYGYDKETREPVSLTMDENIENDNHYAKLTVNYPRHFEGYVYKANIPSGEEDNYFNAILAKISHLLKDANVSLNTLNPNFYNLLLKHYSFLNDCFDKLDMKTPNLPVVDGLFERYFDSSLINKKTNEEVNNKKIYHI